MGERRCRGRRQGQEAVGCGGIALADQHAVIAARFVVEGEFQSVIDPLAGIEQVVAGQPVRPEQVAVTEFEPEAVLVRDLAVVAAGWAGIDPGVGLDYGGLVLAALRRWGPPGHPPLRNAPPAPQT